MSKYIMSLFLLLSGLFGGQVFAQGVVQPAPQPPGFSQVLGQMFPMLAVVFLIFYFMVLRPQEKKLKETQALLESLKKGDNVVTSGGILGRVVQVEDQCVVLDLGGNVKVKVEKAHIAKREATPGSAAQAA